MMRDPVELRETHISWVLLKGDRAYKLKKPLRLPFLDYGSLERRHQLCREEVRLNRRLAPDVYRGVRALVPDSGGVRLAPEDAPGAVEYAVEMRRYDEDATLAPPARRRHGGRGRGRGGRPPDRRLSRRRRPAGRPRAGSRRVRGDAERELRDPARAACGAVADRRRGAARHGRARRSPGRAAAASARRPRARRPRGPARRARRARARDRDRRLREFDPGLREMDVGLDLAFLVMDLLRRDERLVAKLVAAYRAAGGDPGDDALVAFFAAQRALIRAKVALVRAGQVDGADAARRRADAERCSRSRSGSVAGADRASSGCLRAGRQRQVDARGDDRRAGWGARPVVGSRSQEALGSRADGAGACERLPAGRQPPDLQGARAAGARGDRRRRARGRRRDVPVPGRPPGVPRHARQHG